MAVSSTVSWNPSLIFIIRQAYLNATVISEDEEPSANMYESGLYSLNGMVKTLEATGIHVWTEEEAVLFLQPGYGRPGLPYILGGAAPNAHAADVRSYLLMELALDAAAGATTIEVTEDLGVADGMQIGIVLSSGLTQWTTADGAPTGTTITLTDALDEAADAGALIFAYATDITRPLKVPNARLLTWAGLNETQMSVLSRQEYMDQPNKLSSGTPTQWFYSPRREDGELYVWPLPATSAFAMRFTWYRALADFLIPTNTADMPQEWILPLTWNLSKEIATSYGVPELTFNRIEKMADNYAMTAISYDRESEPVAFGLDWSFATSR